MSGSSEAPKISFPVTVWYIPETGKIGIARRTDPVFEAEIGPSPECNSLKPSLYDSLLMVLTRAGKVNSDATNSAHLN